jgi:hypothetical protein
MSFCDRLTNFFKELYPRNETEAVKKEEPELDSTVHNETKIVVEEIKPLTIEETKLVVDEIKPLTIEDVDTDGSEYEIPLEEKNNVLEFEYNNETPMEEELVDEVRPACDALEFECDERELIQILEDKEKEQPEDDHRFSMY